jgi:hypothetical protein
VNWHKFPLFASLKRHQASLGIKSNRAILASSEKEISMAPGEQYWMETYTLYYTSLRPKTCRLSGCAQTW